MGVYTYKGKSAYIDDRLQIELKDNIIPELKEKDSDVVFVIDGKERTGKSKFSDTICGYVASQIGTDYSVDNVHLSPTQFRNAIIKAKKNDIVVYDEAHKGMGSRRSLSEINGILNDLMMEMGQKNLFVVLILPTFFMLDKYPALYRTRGLFHVYRGLNPQTNKRERGFWCYFNEKYKQELYIKGKQYLNYNVIPWTNFRGRFYNQWIMDEEQYREKKRHSFTQHGKRETKAEVYLDQRNALIFALHEELKLGSPNLTKKLSEYHIHLSQAGVEKAILSGKLSLDHKKKHKDAQKEDKQAEDASEDEDSD